MDRFGRRAWSGLLELKVLDDDSIFSSGDITKREVATGGDGCLFAHASAYLSRVTNKASLFAFDRSCDDLTERLTEFRFEGNRTAEQDDFFVA